MIIKGRYGEAKIYTNELEKEVKDQIIRLLDQDYTQNHKIRIMPDCHKGLGCVIGYTEKLTNQLVPNIVGVDIGCGMLTVPLRKTEINFSNLDQYIKENIPSGHSIHSKTKVNFPSLNKLYAYSQLKNIDRIKKSLGTLGGGNHFIEINKDEFNMLYLVIHSGSRNLGNQVAKIYQDLAVKQVGDKYPNDLCYLEGEELKKYLHDLEIVTDYAKLNRETIANIILKFLDKNLNLSDTDYFHTIHNTVDKNDQVVRKGAIPARKNEKILIPFNMKDGSIIAIGKGNDEWNQSAPHGAGRLLSRRQAHSSLSLQDFQQQMKNIFTSSVHLKTLDEAPDAYKPKEDIINLIEDTCSIYRTLLPLYNFKA